MKRWLMALAVGISANGGTWALAQETTLPPPPMVPDGSLPQPMPQPPAADPHGKSFWTFVEDSRERLGTCGTRLCQSPAGQLAYNITAPLRALSGGLWPDRRHVPPTPADLARLQAECASPAEILAMRIQLDEANAQHRIAAIRYLATRDCHYWHEAEEVLLTSLRCDRNECVRYEAAKALASGCCGTPRAMEKLNLVVIGSEADGNPVEKSERVKSEAHVALQRCLAQRPRSAYLPPPVQTLPPPEMLPFPPAASGPPIQQMSMVRQSGDPSHQDADQALRIWAASAGAPNTQPALRPHRTLIGLMRDAAQPQENPTPVPPIPAPKPSLPTPAPQRSFISPLTPIGQIPPNAVSMPVVDPGSPR